MPSLFMQELMQTVMPLHVEKLRPTAKQFFRTRAFVINLFLSGIASAAIIVPAASLVVLILFRYFFS